MNTWYSFLSMGKYTFYVWSAYSMVIIVFTANFIHARCQRKQILKSLQLRWQAKQ